MYSVVIVVSCIVWLGSSLHFLNMPRVARKAWHSAADTLHMKPIITRLDAATTDTQKSADFSFVRDELRPYAMKLHTRDQAPKEGKQKAQTPFTQWQVARIDYLRFLVDSLAVYETFEDIAQKHPQLGAFRDTGLERAEALRQDIEWLTEEYDTTLKVPVCGPAGQQYSSFIRELAEDSMPRFMCHYYNHYFAHTAGGRMIGKRMSDLLLEGHTLNFYKWEKAAAAAEAAGGDQVDGVKLLLGAVQQNIDKMAQEWTQEERQQCCEETQVCFKFGGSLMTYMQPPKST